MLGSAQEKIGNQPSHIVYHVDEQGGDDKAYWTKIGAMWPHKDGEGYNLQLQLLPVNSSGKLTIRVNKPKEDQPAG